MPRSREINQVIAPTGVLEGAGVRLRRSFPSAAVDYIDPFLLLDDFSSAHPDDYRKGFPWHPHRGIETVTYLLSGQVNHKDSLGNSGTIGGGDVQWLTAGRGVMHAEMPVVGPEALIGFQLWANLPAMQKMCPPRYQDLSANQIPEVPLEGDASVRVISGEYAGVAGPVQGIAIAPTYLDVRLLANGVFACALAPGMTVLAYLFEGEERFGSASSRSGRTVTAPALTVFGDGDQLAARASENGARFLTISGRPIQEPIARYGPCVMNTREEIEEALRDLRTGRFVRQIPEDRQ